MQTPQHKALNPSRRTALRAVAAGLVAAAAPAAWAEEARGTRAEAKKLADAAMAQIAKVGFAKALTDFADKSKWNDRDLYIVVFDFNGKCLFHGTNEKLIGKDMIDIKDPDGRPFVQNFIAAAKKEPESWVDLTFASPVSKKIEPKTMNTRRVPGQDAVLVVGYYH